MFSFFIKRNLLLSRQCRSIFPRKSFTKFRSTFNLDIKNSSCQMVMKQNFHISACLNKIISFNLSDIGEGIREVVIKEWFVKEGDTIEQFDNLCEVQSDKASVTITSRYDGKIIKIYKQVDEIALVGKPLVDFEIKDDEGQNSDSESDNETSSKTEKVVKTSKGGDEDVTENHRVKVLATPAVRRIAMENKVDLGKVKATGKLGRVLKGDILEYLGEIPVGTTKPHPTLLQNYTGHAKISVPENRVEPLKGIRKAMLKSMNESLKIPHFAYSDEIEMTNLIELRKQLVDEARKRGVEKLTFMPFCIKAASLALNEYPILNSSLDLEKENVIYKGSHNISVAIDTPEGLVVPNVKNCQQKSIMHIAKDLQELTKKARSNSLKPEDIADGTFSLSNIGIIGGTYTHPCILPPQVAIGAMGKTKVVPRFGENDEIIKANIMCVSWSADHRVVDGVTMAKFSNLWKNYLENPNLFLLD